VFKTLRTNRKVYRNSEYKTHKGILYVLRRVGIAFYHNLTQTLGIPIVV